MWESKHLPTLLLDSNLELVGVIKPCEQSKFRVACKHEHISFHYDITSLSDKHKGFCLFRAQLFRSACTNTPQ